MTTTFRIAHISDLHFGRTNREVTHALIEHLNDTAPDLIVVSGDLTQTAAKAEFIEARAFLDALKPELLVIPGNHDLPGWNFWKRFIGGFNRYRSYISPDLDMVWRNERAIVVGLNSARQFHLHWNWSHGALSTRQLNFAANQFAAADHNAVKVLALHHPLVPPADRPQQKLVRNARKVAEMISQQGADLVMTGHLHRTQTRLLSSHHAGLDWDLPILQTATTTSTRLRGQENGLSHISFQQIGMEIESWNWTGAEFSKILRENFARIDNAGWAARAE